MALTLEYMRELVRSRLDDEDFEDEYLDQSLREAQWDILRNRNLTFEEKSVTVTLSTGTNTVPLPTDMRSLVGMRVVAAGIQSYNISEYFVGYPEFQQNTLQSTGASSAPLQWTTFGGKVIFPVNADKDYTITFDYIKIPNNPIAIAETFEIPDDFQELLKIGAYMRIAKREDDYDVRDAELQDYNRLLNDLTRAYARNPDVRHKHVMSTMQRR